MHKRQPVIVITAGGPYPWVLINALATQFPDIRVIEESPEPKSVFLKRRLRLIGFWQTVGQFFTMLLSRFGKRFASRRESEIVETTGARTTPDPSIPVTRVPSLNSPECIAAIAAAAPGVVVLASCRLMRASTLSAIACPVLNYHPGITPQYRGMWGGYWARAFGDTGNYGATVHLVDPGVDTGAVIRQVRHAPHPRETIFTDALAQAAAARGIVAASVADALAGKLAPVAVSGVSRQHFHPPIWSYLWRGITKKTW